jgi:hypothetical protein
MRKEKGVEKKKKASNDANFVCSAKVRAEI